jgi:hypothetical protein
MNKDKMKPKDLKSFRYTYENKSDGSKKEIFVGYDRMDRLVGVKNEQELENFAYDIINHVGIKSWKKETSNSQSKDKWEIYLGGKDRTGVIFSGKGPYLSKEFEDGVDRWGVLMQLLEIFETKLSEENNGKEKSK